MITYNILPTAVAGKFQLVSIVPTNFGGDAVNFICEGTYDYCKSVRDRLVG